MKKFIAIFFAVCLFLPRLAFAEFGACTGNNQPHGESDFSVAIDVLATANSGQSVTLERGNSGYVLWYTDSDKIPGDYERVFYEPNLFNGNAYNVLITYEHATNTLTYYRKLDRESESSYVEINKATQDLGNGNGSFKVEGENVSRIKCSDEAEVPTIPEPDLDQVCRYFPQPVQSWITEGTEAYSSYPKSDFYITSASATVTGWSEQYLSDKRNIYTYTQDWQGGQSWDNLRVGFDTVSNAYMAYEMPNASGCQGLGCYPGDDDGLLNSRKAEAPEPLNVTFEATEHLDITSGNYASVCDSTYCDYKEEASQTVITINRDLKKLSVNAYSGNPIIFKFSQGIKIELMELADNSGAYFNEGDNLYFGQITIGGNGTATLSFETGVTLNIVGTGSDASYYTSADFRMGNPTHFYYPGAEGNSDFVIPTIYAPSASVHLKAHEAIKAFILAKQAYFDVDITIEGSVTANYLWINGNVEVIRDDLANNCWDGGDVRDDYTLVLSPESDIALVCEDIKPTISVVDNGQLVSDFSGTVVVNVDGDEQRYSNASNQFTIQSGGASKTVSVTAYIQGEQNSSVSGSYEFVPYKFAADDQYVIAGKTQQVEAKALACDDNGGVVDTGYSGSPTVQTSWHIPSGGSSVNPVYTPEFVAGIANSDLTLDEAGKVEVILEDTNFDCSELADCPIEGSIDLKGNFMVYSRPWTFALCSVNGIDLDIATGTSSGGVGFIAAGEKFDVRVLPIKYQSAISQEVESNSAWCIESNITSNFFSDSSSGNNVKLSSEVATPESHASIVLLASSDEMTKPRVNSGNMYQFTNLYWNDVGSLKVMASTENYSQTCGSPNGLEGWYECTQLGYRNIGRFYPHHFKLDSNRWSAVDGQNEINYMGQPFALAEVYIAPYAKGANAAVSNYHLFSDALVAKFDVADDVDIDNRLILDTELGTWHENASVSQWSLNDVDAYVSKLISPNGPFNTGDASSEPSKFGLTISGTDPVQFDSEDGEVLVTQELANQPPVRFGRIQLDDVGGSQGTTLTVPLRVQYWNGERFVQNTDDNATAVEAELEKQELLWSRNGSNCDVELSGNSTVVVGVMRDLIAKQLATPCTETGRQQSQLWLELDSTANPLSWLKYDWNNDGSEENPSSVVTFGIHRGNDRVIYRGEPGLTGM